MRLWYQTLFSLGDVDRTGAAFSRSGPRPGMAMARNDGPPPQPQQNFGVWISRDEWKKQQVELKRGAEAYNQLLQEIEKKDRSIESLRVASAENLQARRDAEEKVRAPSSARPARARACSLRGGRLLRSWLPCSLRGGRLRSRPCSRSRWTRSTASSR